MTYLGPSLRRTRLRQRWGLRALTAVLLSLALNGLFAVVLVQTGFLDFVFATHAPSTPTAVDLAPLAADRWAANRAVTGSAPRAPPPTPSVTPPPPPPDRPQGQVVDVAPSKDSTPPKESRFLSERNSTVEKETRSRFARRDYAHPAPVPQAPAPSAPRGEAGHAESSVAGKEGPHATHGTGAAALANPGRRARDRLALAPQPGGEIRGGAHLPLPTGEGRGEGGSRGQPGVEVPGDGEGGTRKAGRLDARLMPTAESLARIAGAPAPDHLEGVEEGDATFLNTREWKYATYFNRIKQAVASAWQPERVIGLRDANQATFGSQDRTTTLMVTLDRTGAVKDLAVARTSGLDLLDRSAVEAFRQAQPFTNPPPGIIDGRGEIRFPFSFIVYGSSSGIRVLWGQPR